MNILYVSYCVPYDKAYNAGAQSLNYYIKRMSEKEDIKIDVVSYCNKNDAEQIASLNVNYLYHFIIRPDGVRRLIGRVSSINSKYNPWHKSCNLMTRYSTKLLLDKLQAMSQNGYVPNIIFLEWTQIVLLVGDIKKIFPSSIIIASEPDVTYLSFYRKYNNTQNLLLKKYKQIQYHNCIRREINALKKCDYIFVQSNRDKKLVTDRALELESKIGIQLPYYHKTVLPRDRRNNDILFFGSMGRAENINAVEWFIENVMPLLSDIPCRFVVLGSGITEELRRYSSDRIVLKGFVPSIDDEFSKAMCFVCPLLLGAGTKVKVIESLYSGIPVLTNSIGIEGINAENGKDYYHCELPEDYAATIEYIYSNPNSNANGRAIIDRDFSLETSFANYYKTVKELYKSGGK